MWNGRDRSQQLCVLSSSESEPKAEPKAQSSADKERGDFSPLCQPPCGACRNTRTVRYSQPTLTGGLNTPMPSPFHVPFSVPLRVHGLVACRWNISREVVHIIVELRANVLMTPGVWLLSRPQTALKSVRTRVRIIIHSCPSQLLRPHPVNNETVFRVNRSEWMGLSESDISVGSPS